MKMLSGCAEDARHQFGAAARGSSDATPREKGSFGSVCERFRHSGQNWPHAAWRICGQAKMLLTPIADTAPLMQVAQQRKIIPRAAAQPL